MKWNGTILWRFAVLGLFASLVPLGLHALDKHDKVDTDRMLDVSVSIRTMSHVTVDKFGDSVWEINNGSGFLVSSRTCEVWIVPKEFRPPWSMLLRDRTSRF
jgi:hypothetical protein